MIKSTVTAFALAALLLSIGCGSDPEKQRDFHTSGSHEADQRAEQRIAADQQIKGKGEGQATDAKTGNKSLFDRLGGTAGESAIVDDFLQRAIADPRVNFERKGVTRGGVLGVGGAPAEWKPTPDNLQVLKKHFVQFLALATGGPSAYDGQEMAPAHKGLKITNAEFDAIIGDMKASLDSKNVPVVEQKELLAVLESTRIQVVEEK